MSRRLLGCGGVVLAVLTNFWLDFILVVDGLATTLSAFSAVGAASVLTLLTAFIADLGAVCCGARTRDTAGNVRWTGLGVLPTRVNVHT